MLATGFLEFTQGPQRRDVCINIAYLVAGKLRHLDTSKSLPIPAVS